MDADNKTAAMDEECLPLSYRKFYEDLPDQINTMSPARISKKVNQDIFSSPNTVVTLASTVISSTEEEVSHCSSRVQPPSPPLFVAASAPSGRKENLEEELAATKDALRKLEGEVQKEERQSKNNDTDVDELSTSSTEALSGAEVHNDPWNESLRSLNSLDFEHFSEVPESVDVPSTTSKKFATPDHDRSVLKKLEKAEERARLLEQKLQASEAVATSLFKNLLLLKKRQSELDRLNKDAATCEDVEILLQQSLLLRVTGALVLFFLFTGHVELFAIVVALLLFSLEAVGE